MKTAFSTVACMGLPWQNVLGSAVRAGMDAVEIRMDDDGRIFGLPDAGLEAMGRAFREAGVTVSDIGSGIRFSDFAVGAVGQARRWFVKNVRPGRARFSGQLRWALLRPDAP
jgi:sugar phosphate isomerase/epimerase